MIQGEYNSLIKLRLALFESVFFFGIFIFIVVLVSLSAYLCVKQKRKKKILAARSLSFDLDEVYDGDPVFKTTATIGDSTLKVSPYARLLNMLKLKHLNKRYIHLLGILGTIYNLREWFRSASVIAKDFGETDFAKSFSW